MTNEEQGAGSRWSRLRTRYLPVLVITLVVGVVGSLFVFSYSSALGNPTPRNVPIGLVTTGSGAAGSVPGALTKAAGTAVQAIRDITYFPGAIHGEPFVILLLWLVVTTGAMIGLRLRKQRRAELAALLHRLETA